MRILVKFFVIAANAIGSPLSYEKVASSGSYDSLLRQVSDVLLVPVMTSTRMISIRKAEAADVSQMIRIMDEALETPTVDDEMEERVVRWLVKFNQTSQYVFYLAEIDDGILIGWCRGGHSIECHRTVAGQTYDGEVQNIFIRPQYQNRGIGRELWKATWNGILEQFHPKNIVVWSVDKDATRAFYVSLGGIERERKEMPDDDCTLTCSSLNKVRIRSCMTFTIPGHSCQQ